MKGSFIFYLLGIVDVCVLFYNLGQTFKWLTCTETNTPYILKRREYIIKYQKYIYLIILSLSDLTFASGREGIDNPFIALVASSQFVCVGAWDF